LDNLERALQHTDGSSDLKSWVEGVELTFKQFSEILSKSGVTPIQCVGLPFDPNRQQAMAQVETEIHEDNTVVEEYQKGYMLHDRVLRPAMVTVAKRKNSGSEEQKPQE
jgi:molecular chaperone GrpE